MMASGSVIVTNSTVLNASTGERTPDSTIRIEDGIIKEVGRTREAPTSDSVQRIDARGRTVMPGLIDGHVHVLGLETDLGKAASGSSLYLAARSSRLLRDMLMRGFTTVRDVGGAEYGLARAVEEGYFAGPKIIYGGKALSQTGGHGDFRTMEDSCNHGHSEIGIGKVCDGVDEVRRACREEIRHGASHIKLMLGGGIASPTDRIDSDQFSLEEIDAAVEEAAAANIYVTGHAYGARSINRALQHGVRCIEHGNLLDDESVRLFVEKDAYLVPTLATGRLLASEEGAQYGVGPETREKAQRALRRGLEGLERAHRGGVNLVFGSDFIGPMHPHQLEEFNVRAEVQTPLEVIRSATVTAARLLGRERELGVIAEGARGDILILDGDPVENISVLTNPQKYLSVVVQEGNVLKEEVQP